MRSAVDTSRITTAEEYEAALAEIATYFAKQPRLGTPEAAHFDQLSAQIVAYENERHPIQE